MKLSARIFLAYFLLVGFGAYWFISSLVDQLHPAIRQSSEEALVDTANLLAELASEELAHDLITVGNFADAVDHYRQRQLDAQIWSLQKTQPNLSLYVTDLDGIVVYHTDTDELGTDYAKWNDVKRTLAGEYGARTSRLDPDDPLSSTMFVAAPIRYEGELIGVLTVGQPNASVLPVVELARNKIWQRGIIILLISLTLGAVMTVWLTRSIRQLTEYAEAVRAGIRIPPPELREEELAHLADAMESMLRELEGKEYVENYIHTLTHEMKSPLAAIQGASELLQEAAMSEEDRARFLHNIRSETERMRHFIDRLLSLASVEKRTSLQNPESVELVELLRAELDSKKPLCDGKGIHITLGVPANPLSLQGETFLLRQAISNLLDNAIDFTPEGKTIEVTLEKQQDSAAITITNPGQPIPDYALHRIFERFYSLPRPGSGRKSSGLGLSFVKEVAELHRGWVKLSNTADGVEAEFSLPLAN